MKAINVNKMTTAGVTFRFWVADWFALMNNKMGGDLKKIRKVGEYMIEVSQTHDGYVFVMVHLCIYIAG